MGSDAIIAIPLIILLVFALMWTFNQMNINTMSRSADGAAPVSIPRSQTTAMPLPSIAAPTPTPFEASECTNLNPTQLSKIMRMIKMAIYASANGMHDTVSPATAQALAQLGGEFASISGVTPNYPNEAQYILYLLETGTIHRGFMEWIATAPKSELPDSMNLHFFEQMIREYNQGDICNPPWYLKMLVELLPHLGGS